MSPSRGGIVIFSGGSAANSLVDVFESIRKSRSCSLSYIIPISDNGGSSSELIRVFGGPGIGDVRSRLLRLIPPHPYSKEKEAVGTLLSYRLSSSNSHDARNGWADIVEGTSPLWQGISSAKKELIRSFLNLVNLEILKRSRPPTSTFDFRSASIGNLFLTGARLFSGSFESAIYLLSAVCGIPDEEIKVIPSINSNFSHHIAAELEDGTVIVGQNSISHPSVVVKKVGEVHAVSKNLAPVLTQNGEMHRALPLGMSVARPTETSDDYEFMQEAEDAHPPFTLATLRTNNISFTKAADELDDLPSRIRRLHYVNSFGQEILPPANPRAIQAIQSAQSIIFSIGSLYTSIVPNLVLRGIGDAMRKSNAACKVLILNGCLDREVGPEESNRQFTAIDFIHAIVKAGEQSRGVAWPSQATNHNTKSEAVPHVKINEEDFMRRPSFQRTYSEGYTLTRGGPEENTRILPPPMLASAMPSRLPSPSNSPSHSTPRFPSTSVSSRSPSTPSPVYKHYVTHVIHLPNSHDTPFVDREQLAMQCGIRCIRVYGRRNASGPGMLYDPLALQGAIEAVLGGRGQDQTLDDGVDGIKPRVFERGRRKTVEI